MRAFDVFTLYGLPAKSNTLSLEDQMPGFISPEYDEDSII